MALAASSRFSSIALETPTVEVVSPALLGAGATNGLPEVGAAAPDCAGDGRAPAAAADGAGLGTLPACAVAADASAPLRAASSETPAKTLLLRFQILVVMRVSGASPPVWSWARR